MPRLLYLLERAQGVLPLNPQGQAGMAPDLAFNTAVSFTTNTNWQNYGGESTLSYLVQMVGLTFHNFVSAATGIAIAVALIRGFARATTRSLGNFWVDLTRCTLYVLLPVCLVYALFLVWQGVPQTLGAYVDATTLEGGKQTIAVGPVASQEAIKKLGTNGGGFFNANSAHPFENPTPLTNFIEIVSIFVLGVGADQHVRPHGGRRAAGLGDPRRHGRPVPRRRHALLLGRGAGQPDRSPTLGVDQATLGGNMEGKEVRFGIPGSALFATVTTDASCGAVNAMHDSFSRWAAWCR